MKTILAALLLMSAPGAIGYVGFFWLPCKICGYVERKIEEKIAPGKVRKFLFGLIVLLWIILAFSFSAAIFFTMAFLGSLLL